MLFNCSLSKPAADFQCQQVKMPSVQAAIGGLPALLGAAWGDYMGADVRNHPSHGAVGSGKAGSPSPSLRGQILPLPQPSPQPPGSWPQQPGKERVSICHSRRCSQPGEWY